MKTTNRFESFSAMQSRANDAARAIENLQCEMTLQVSYMAPVVINSPIFNDAVCQDAVSDLLADEVRNWLVSSPTVRVPFQSTDKSDTDLGVASFIL
jgi:hypothetical protein